jgi:methyl-accepting chemotaxis protein
VIQQNAGAAEEMSSTAEELSSQAEQLQSTIEFFRIEDNGSAQRGAAQARAASKAVHTTTVSYRSEAPKTIWTALQKRGTVRPAGVRLAVGDGGINGDYDNYDRL